MASFGNSGQGKQHCFELFVVCLKDAEDSWTGEDCNSPGMKEHRQEQEFNTGHSNSSLCILVGAVAFCCMSFLDCSWLYTSSWAGPACSIVLGLTPVVFATSAAMSVTRDPQSPLQVSARCAQPVSPSGRVEWDLSRTGVLADAHRVLPQWPAAEEHHLQRERM